MRNREQGKVERMKGRSKESWAPRCIIIRSYYHWEDEHDEIQIFQSRASLNYSYEQ